MKTTRTNHGSLIALPPSPFAPIPAWVTGINPIELTRAELEALPEYSCSLPDSYKRPISEGGRPWKRDLNFGGHFGGPNLKVWIYCEYIPHDTDPKLLGIESKRVILVDTHSPASPVIRLSGREDEMIVFSKDGKHWMTIFTPSPGDAIDLERWLDSNIRPNR